MLWLDKKMTIFVQLPRDKTSIVLLAFYFVSLFRTWQIVNVSFIASYLHTTNVCEGFPDLYRSNFAPILDNFGDRSEVRCVNIESGRGLHVKFFQGNWKSTSSSHLCPAFSFSEKTLDRVLNSRTLLRFYFQNHLQEYGSKISTLKNRNFAFIITP